MLKFLTAKLQCRDEAADLRQEAFARFFAVAAPAAIRQPRAFLYRIARNLAIDPIRKRHVQARHLINLGGMAEAPSLTPRPEWNTTRC